MKKILFYFFLIEATLGCSGKQPFFQKNQNDKRWILEWSEDFENPTEFDDYWNAENYAPFLKEKEMELKVSLKNLFTSYWLKLYHITTCSCRRLRKRVFCFSKLLQ